jgi:hypothetical protein
MLMDFLTVYHARAKPILTTSKPASNGIVLALWQGVNKWVISGGPVIG